MSIEEKIEKIKNIVSSGYQSHHCGWTEFRSEGNYSDVFSDGNDCGVSTVLYEIGCILEMELEEPEEQDYEY